MRRTIRPAEEEFGMILPQILFSILWYSALLGNMIYNGFQTILLVFLAAGLIPLYTAVTSIRRTLFYRKQRAEAIALGDVQTGWIRGVVRKDVPYYSGKNHVLRYHRYYHLQVELGISPSGTPNLIESQGYRKPIHRYLGSARVSVYTDQSGWKHYLEDFQWKENKSDPDLFDYPVEFEDTLSGNGNFIQIIFAVIMVLIVLSSFFGIGR